MTKAASNEEIIQGCIKGNRRMQRELYTRFAPMLYGICLRYSKNEMEAEDILQDGFVKIFKNLSKFRPFGPFEGWMRRIVVNTAIEYYRARKKELISEVEIEHVEETVSTDALDMLAEEELLEVIKSIPEGYKMVFNMYAIEGYTHKEIAEQLDISIGTSKSQYSRARSFLQKQILKRENYFLNPSYVEPK